jgi:hypothetical protein
MSRGGRLWLLILDRLWPGDGARQSGAIQSKVDVNMINKKHTKLDILTCPGGFRSEL